MKKKLREPKFDLGVKVRDKVSGFEGITTGYTLSLNGCLQYSVNPRVKASEPEKMPEGWWLDEERLELVIEEKPIKVKPAKVGGPSRPAPMQRA